MSKPTFLLIHGAFHRPAHFQPIISLLESHGYKVIAPALPSTFEPDQKPTSSIDLDIKVIRRILNDELTSNDMIVVMHSFGGIIGCSALEGYDADSRAAAGQKHRVTAIVGISSFILPAGKHALEARGPNAAPLADVDPSMEFGTPGDNAAELFYHDVSDAEKWVKLCRPFSAGAGASVNRFAAYEKFAVHYLVCLQDRAYDVGGQREAISIIREKGFDVRVEEVEASHSPFLSMPERTVEFLRRCAGEAI